MPKLPYIDDGVALDRYGLPVADDVPYNVAGYLRHIWEQNPKKPLVMAQKAAFMAGLKTDQVIKAVDDGIVNGRLINGLLHVNFQDLLDNVVNRK
jgi:hypothetical protein